MALSDAQHHLLLDTLELAEGNPGQLNDWEKEFVKSFNERYDEHAEKTYMSSKQQVCLQKIHDKLIGS